MVCEYMCMYVGQTEYKMHVKALLKIFAYVFDIDALNISLLTACITEVEGHKT